MGESRWSFANTVASTTRKYPKQRSVRPLSCGDTDQMYSLRGESPSSSSTEDNMPCFSRRQHGRRGESPSPPSSEGSKHSAGRRQYGQRGENSSPSALQKVIFQPPPEILPESYIERPLSALDKDQEREEEELAFRRRAEGVNFAWGLTTKSREKWARKKVEKLERAKEQYLQKRIEKARNKVITKEEKAQRKIEKKEETQQRKLERERRLQEAEEKEKQELAGRKRWKINKRISIIWGRKKKDPAIKERERQKKEERERCKMEKKERDRQVNEEIKRWHSVAKEKREKRMRGKMERKRQRKEEREKERQKKEKMQRERQIRKMKEEWKLRKERQKAAERQLKEEKKRQKRERGTHKVVKKKKGKEKKRREKEWKTESDKVKDSWLSSLQMWWHGIERDHLDALHRYNVVKEQNLRRGNLKPQAYDINKLLIERRNLEIDQRRLVWNVKRLEEEKRLRRQRTLRKMGIFTIDDLPIRPLVQ
ncbi:uncharacterized protein LOC141757827 [Sebastes fasciatus]|uniref:uncharacterized protein LOC141757827 n=1 Tax=Sebastes fasciatus TaxID=394691 RepID=UPI003D9E174B